MRKGDNPKENCRIYGPIFKQCNIMWQEKLLNALIHTMRLNLKKAFCLAKETKHKSVYII